MNKYRFLSNNPRTSRILPRFKVYPNGTVVEDKSWDDALLRLHIATRCTKKEVAQLKINSKSYV